MSGALLGLRLLLAAVFAVAGAAKLADPSGSRRALRAFGAPARLVAPAAIVLPLLELGIAVALLVPASARWGALTAGLLLLAFCVVIARAMRTGTDADCHCFGQLHSAPAGGATLARNAALAAAAGFVAVAGGDDNGGDPFGWIAHLSAAGAVGLAGGVLIGVLGLVCFELLRQHGRLLMRIEALEQAAEARPGGPARRVGLPPGAVAPDFTLPDIGGESVTLGSLLEEGRPVMLVFGDPGCGPCAELLPQIARWQEEHRESLTVALVSRGEIEHNRAASAQHGIEALLLQEDREVAVVYHAHGTPSAVLVAADGTIASPVAAGALQIEELVTSATPSPGGRDPSPVRVVPPAPVGGGVR